MPAPISSITPVTMPDVRPTGAGSAGSGDFHAMFTQAIGGVEKLRNTANQSVERFLTGESEEVHTVALATQRAELAFETFVQVRNKVISAYQAVMQMQI